MNKEESARFHELCTLIAVEKDRRKFMELVEELNRLLSDKDQRLREGRDPRTVGEDGSQSDNVSGDDQTKK